MIGKEKISEIIYFGAPYFISVGILYLWGYWASFEINILEFMTLSDIIKTTAYPIISSFIFWALGAILGELIPGASFRKLLPEGGGRDTKIGRFLNRHTKALRTVVFLLIFLFLLFGPPSKWLLLTLLIGIPIYLFLKRAGFLKDLIPNEATRSVIIFLLATMPLTSYAFGKMKANEIIEGNKFKYVLTDILKDSKLSLNIENQKYLKFIGHTNNYIFLQTQDNKQILILTFDKIQILSLQTYEKGKTDATQLTSPKAAPSVSKTAPTPAHPSPPPQPKTQKPG